MVKIKTYLMETEFKETPAQAFEERKTELLVSKKRWRNWFLFNIIVLMGVSLSALWWLRTGESFIGIAWLELVLGVPLIYSAIFFHAQHNREREFLEEYSFKSVVARSLEAYRVLLKEDVNPKHPEEQKRFLDFVIDSVKSLHLPPRAIISKHPLKNEEDIKIGVIEKFADILKRFIPG